MPNYSDESISGYLKDLSSRKIVPGGGSAAALSGALGASLNLMVINFSLGRGDSGTTDRSLELLKKEQSASSEKFSRCIDRDCAVFSELMETLKAKLPAGEKFKEAAMVPMDVCRECAVSIRISEKLMEKANMNLVSDIGCAAAAIKGAFVSAELNVRINLKHVRDGEFNDGMEKELAGIKARIDSAEREILSRVEKHFRKRGADGSDS